MSIIRSDSRSETHNKPVQEGERKLSGGVYVDYVSTAEVIAAVGTEFRKNKYFWIAGSRYHCDSDGITFRTAGVSQADLASRDYYLTEPLYNGFLSVTGVFTLNTSYKTTDYIPVTPNQNLVYTGQVTTTQAICYYDANKTFISSPLAINTTYINQTVKVPAGVSFVRMSSITTAPTISFKVIYFPPDPKIIGFTAAIPAFQQSLINLYAISDYSTGKFTGYIDTTGTFVSNSNWTATDYIAVKQGYPLQYNGLTISIALPVAYYDLNKTFISSGLAYGDYQVNGQSLLVPTNPAIAYVRMCARQMVSETHTFYIGALSTTQRDYLNETPLYAGYLNSTGGFVVLSNYNCTDFIPVVQNQSITYSGVLSTTTYPICFYDSNKTFVSSPLAPNATYLNKPIIVPSGVSFVRMCSRINAGDVVNFIINYYPADPKIKTNSQLVPSIQASLFNIYTLQNYPGAFASFIDLSGNAVSNANWTATDFISVKQGYPLQYKGITLSTVLPVAYYDINKAFISAGLPGGDYQTNVANLLVPANPAIAYVRLSSRNTAGDVYSLNVGAITSGGGGGGSAPAPVFFLPAVAYAKQSELFRMYSFGIIAENSASKSTDAVWGTAGGCLDFWEITPGSGDDNISVQLSARDAFNNLISCGATIVKVTHTTQSPAAAVNIICIGDSVTRGTNSTIEPNGAYPNEFSRRLTGVGTAIPSTPSPTALALTNIYFRGTLGSLTIKHEGRGGWNLYNYLFNSSFSVNTNAFWNPATSKFDLAYYLSQNNFNAAQTTNGVDATGSNLVIYLMLGWNDLGASGYSVDQAGIYLNQMLDIIHTSHVNCKIKLLGLTQPASVFYRAGGGYNSSKYWMNDKIVPLAKKWQSIADGRSAYVEFIPNAPFFNPLECFVTISKKLHNRSNTNVNYVNELPHPNDQGYGQIADVAFMNFLYNYCRAT
jgi:lysophospholipase L1-like esterase